MGPGPPDDSGDLGETAATESDHPVIRRAGRDLYQAGRDLHVHHHGVRRVSGGPDSADAVCPYPGLAAFTGQQAEWFYGRERLTADLLTRMGERLDQSGPVMVVAASGAGKSSLLRAGLLHQIAGGSLPAEGSRHWPRVWFTPGSHPMRNAAAALTATLPEAADTSAIPLEPGAEDLDRLLREALKATAGRAARVVMVVDQLEELFTLCESEAERRAFVTWLCRAAGGDDPRQAPALVACGLRADFYAECVSGYPRLRQSLEDSQVIVGPMSREELRQAICYPAEDAGLEIEPGLTDLLLADLRAGDRDREPGAGDPAADYNAGRLPLLAHALRATWQQRHGAVLTVDAYRATGGIEHAIARTAEQVYAGLSEDERRESRIIFLRLVKIGATAAEDVRRPAARSGLTSGAHSAVVIGAYTRSRLLTTARDAVQITHEALLVAWPRLKGWLEEDRADSLKRQAVEDAAAEWKHSGEDSSLLYRGARLETIVAWAAGRSLELTQTARAFLAASQRHAHRLTLAWRSAAAILAALAIGASVLAAVALHEGASANHETTLALSARNLAASDALAAQSQATGDTDPAMARLEAIAASRIQPTARAARYAMLSAALLPWADLLSSADGTSVTAVAFSPHGKLLATGTFGGAIQLCDLAAKDACTLLPDAVDRVDSVAFSRDGKLLAAGTFDGKIEVFDVISREPAFTLPAGRGSTVYSVAFSPNGRLLAAGIGTRAGTGTAQLWNLASRTLTAALPAIGANDGVNSVNSVAFSSDGSLLAAGTVAGEVQLWDLTAPTPQSAAPAITGGDVDAVALSTDGKLLAAGMSNGSVQLWDLASRTLEHTLTADSTHAVFSVALSPDGKLLAVDTGSGTTQLWDLASRTLKAALPAGSTDSVQSVAFSAGSDLLATGTLTGTRLSDIAADLAISSPIATLPIGKPSSVVSVAFSPDGKLLAVGVDPGTIQLWDVTARTLRATLPVGADGLAWSMAFSPDGKVLAAGTSTGTVQLWDVATSALQATLPVGAKSVIFSVVFSPDGGLLAASDGNSTRLWDVTAHGPAARATISTGTKTPVDSLAFSPGGRLLAAGTGSGAVQLWDVTSRQPTVTATLPDGTTNEVWSVAFSPDGKLLAAETVSGTVRVWNVAGRPQVTIASILTNGLSAVAFTSDRTTLAIGDGQGVQLWDTGTGQRIGVLPVGSFDNIFRGGLMAVSQKTALLAVGTGAGTVQLWSTPYLTDTVPYLCALAGQSFPATQWAEDAPGLPYMATCP